jgi:hypothetical protein
MKDLKDFINESMRIDEAVKSVLAFWQNSPHNLFVVVGSSSEINKLHKEMGDGEVAALNSNMCTIMWNDESMFVNPIKARDINDLKKQELASIKKQMNAQKNNEGSDDYIYLDSLISGSGNEWYDEEAQADAKDYMEAFISMVEGSYVDGDSSYGRAVIDANKLEASLKGGDDITVVTIEQWREMTSEE